MNGCGIIRWINRSIGLHLLLSGRGKDTSEGPVDNAIAFGVAFGCRMGRQIQPPAWAGRWLAELTQETRRKKAMAYAISIQSGCLSVHSFFQFILFVVAATLRCLGGRMGQVLRRSKRRALVIDDTLTLPHPSGPSNPEFPSPIQLILLHGSLSLFVSTYTNTWHNWLAWIN